MRCIGIWSAKGGSGKTTTAVTLAHGLALAGQRVLLVDCDPRRDAAIHFGLAPRPGLAAWLAGEPAEAIEVRPGLAILDSGGDALVALEASLAGVPARARLRSALATIAAIDTVILDCPAGFGAIARLALAAADEAILPLAGDYLSLAGAEHALAWLDAAGAGPAPRLLGILPTFHLAGSAGTVETEAVLAEFHAQRTLQTRIAVSDAVRDAPARRGTIFDCDPLSHAALEHARLVEEVLAAGQCAAPGIVHGVDREPSES